KTVGAAIPPSLLLPHLVVDVGTGADPLDDPPLGVAQRQGTGQEPAVGAVGRPPHADFELLRLAGPEAVVPVGHHPRQVVRVNDGMPTKTGRLGRGKPAVIVTALVPEVIPPVRRRAPDELREGVREKAVLFPPGPQRLLGILAVGDVLVRTGHAVDPAGRVTQDEGPAADPAVRAVLVPEAKLHPRQRLPALEVLAKLLPNP